MNTATVTAVREVITQAVEQKRAVFLPLPDGQMVEIAPSYKNGKLARVEVTRYNTDEAAPGEGDS